MKPATDNQRKAFAIALRLANKSAFHKWNYRAPKSLFTPSEIDTMYCIGQQIRREIKQ